MSEMIDRILEFERLNEHWMDSIDDFRAWKIAHDNLLSADKVASMSNFELLGLYRCGPITMRRLRTCAEAYVSKYR